MASKVCVFDNAISSRSVLIDQMLGISFFAMMLPPTHSTAVAGSFLSFYVKAL
jgi:hypothetical protein